MKKAEMKVYKERLLALRARLRGDVHAMADAALNKTRSEASGDLSVMPIHMADIGSDNFEQEFTLGLVESERKLLNRIDDVIIFDALSRDDLLEIVALQLERLNGMLAERGIQLEVGEAARRRLADAGYDPAYGARPLRRAIQRMVQDPLSLQLIEGAFAPGDRIVADLDGETIVLRQAEAAGADLPVSR